jgi:hypothetical protein
MIGLPQLHQTTTLEANNPIPINPLAEPYIPYPPLKTTSSQNPSTN